MTAHIAVGVLVSDDGVLMSHRSAQREHAPNTWSFAGGHVEPGETVPAALARELREELGVTVTVDDEPHLRVIEHAGSRDEVEMSVWIVREWIGTPYNAAPEEHDELRWVRAAHLDGLELAHDFCRTIVEDFGRGR